MIQIRILPKGPRRMHPALGVAFTKGVAGYSFYHGNWECLRGAKRLLKKFKKGQAKIVMGE